MIGSSQEYQLKLLRKTSFRPLFSHTRQPNSLLCPICSKTVHPSVTDITFVICPSEIKSQKIVVRNLWGEIGKMEPRLILSALLIIAAPRCNGKCLVREPPDLTSAPVIDDAGFGLSISGSPKYYEPGNLYTVSLKVQAIFATHNLKRV